MPTQTLLQVITEAYKKAGLVADNHTLDARQSTKGKDNLNMLLGLWSAKGLMIHAGTIENFNLVAGTASYTIGASGNFNTTRPEKILNWWIRDSGGTDYTDTEIWGADRYQVETAKTTSGRPYGLWFQPRYPLAYIWLYPTPDAVEAIYLYSEKPLTEITVLTSNIVLPNEYLIALQFNLAILLCSGIKQPSQDLIAWAGESLRIIENKNLSLQVEKLSISGFPHSNIRGERFNITNYGA